MLKKNDSLPLYFDGINGNIALGFYLENEDTPSVFYLDKHSDSKLRSLDPFMEEIGHIPIESKLVIDTLEAIIKSDENESNSSKLTSFLEKCKKRAVSDRKVI